MRLVVDTNVLLTAFWKNSAFGNISRLPNLTLNSPEYALEEIRGHRAEITKKAGIDSARFEQELGALSKQMRFFKEEEYRSSLKVVSKSLKELPLHERGAVLDDIDFLALAHERRCALWSNDALLKRQEIVDVLSTRELVLLLRP